MVSVFFGLDGFVEVEEVRFMDPLSIILVDDNAWEVAK